MNSQRWFGQVSIKDSFPRERRPATQTDAEHIAASCSDPEWFGAIFERHFDTIYQYLACRIGADAADDLASEVFSVAFRRRSSYDLTRDNARPWLYGIATNLLHRHHRTEQRQLRAYARSDLRSEGFDATTVIARVDAGTWRAAVAVALAALKPRDRDVLLLFSGEDQSYQDIANALGIPVGTVRSRLNRARRIVRERLSQSGQYLRDHDVVLHPPEEVLDGRA